MSTQVEDVVCYGYSVLSSIWQRCIVDQGFPVIFHGVMGKDEREANSPSFFNVSEIEVLISYLKKLQISQGKKGLPKLSANDIGIIAPYRKQVRTLIILGNLVSMLMDFRFTNMKIHFLRWRKCRKLSKQ